MVKQNTILGTHKQRVLPSWNCNLPGRQNKRKSKQNEIGAKKREKQFL